MALGGVLAIADLGRRSFEREAVGRDGERYAWTLIDVAEIRERQVALTCQFELEDEEVAFAYAEERMRATEGQ